MASEKPTGIQLNSNTYFNRDGVVTKLHGKGKKLVKNPKTIAAVVAASNPPTPISSGKKSKE